MGKRGCVGGTRVWVLVKAAARYEQYFNLCIDYYKLNLNRVLLVWVFGGESVAEVQDE